MTTPIPLAKTAPHPLMITAAVAVVLFCGVGTAAVMGWLPSSAGTGQSASAPLNPPDEQSGDAAARRQTEQRRLAALDEHREQNERHRAAPAPARQQNLQAAVCHQCGVIESVREITTRAQGSGVGAAGGAVLGGLLGNQVGGGHGRQLATVVGAVGGAVAGNQIEGNVNASHSYEIVVRMDDGSSRTLHQGSKPGWGNGDSVKVVNGQLRANG
ncbi:glycine zipper 2TM domain-containing protein [Rugamonas sp. CCM 8940]|uniref:glycine zipper 2TM domain-containing protein n=1 Tax=Rugamonas sp. CCM 8940 TaxID=2765359 RepID=UPI0018F521F3|nr:glycine zipper 2TM domain-containing protein [Rugamonas sp. CCM 8940]MBJ7309252.1 glycine zipper 2TM domain-containing protein [Rugamonas sp. CCM 8940]